MNGLPSRSLSYDFQHLVADDLPAIDTFAPAEFYKKSLDVSIVGQQQAIADIFFQLKLILKKVTIAGSRSQEQSISTVVVISDIQHCEKEWEPSRLTAQETVTGAHKCHADPYAPGLGTGLVPK